MRAGIAALRRGRRALLLAGVAGLATQVTLAAASAQLANQTRWVEVGGELYVPALAGAPGRPVMDVRSGLAPGEVAARLASGDWWRSTDGGESWARLDGEPALGTPLAVQAVQLEGRSLRAMAAAREPERWFALGRDLWMTGDDGASWINLTASGGGPVIGEGQNAIAVDPGDPGTLYAANRQGLWRSRDGGWTWTSLNTQLPNFPRFEVLDPGTRASPARICLPGYGDLAFEARARTWAPVFDEGAQDSAELGPVRGQDADGQLVELVALAGFGAMGQGRYAVDAAGGLWLLEPGAAQWRRQASLPGRGFSVVAVSASGVHSAAAAIVRAGDGYEIHRKTEAGTAWDDISANLPQNSRWRSVKAGPGGIVFVGGDAGVYWSVQRFDAPAPAGEWMPITGSLPEGSVYELALDETSGRLLAAVDGYGLYETDSPAIGATLRAWNAADGSDRAAAPGGLLTLAGGGIERVASGATGVPVLAQSGRETQIQVPFESAGEQLGLRVQAGGREQVLRYPLEPIAPAIFVESGEAIVMDGGTGAVLDTMHPAQAGREILVLCTGLGAVDPRWPTGVPAPLTDPPNVRAAIRATWAGVELRVMEATLAPGYIGSYLVRIELPAGLVGGSGGLRLIAEGKASNEARLFVRPAGNGGL